MREIILLATGGTIEKTYDERDGSLVNRENGREEAILAGLRLPATRVRVERLMSKDSLLMTNEDRHLIIKALRSHLKQEIPIVVHHGTDSMVQTAELAFEELRNLRPPIIFTGAMAPFGLAGKRCPSKYRRGPIGRRLASGRDIHIFSQSNF